MDWTMKVEGRQDAGRHTCAYACIGDPTAPKLGLGCYPAHWYPGTFQIYLADKIHPPASLAGGWQGAVGMPDCLESLFDRHRGIQIPRARADG